MFVLLNVKQIRRYLAVCLALAVLLVGGGLWSTHVAAVNAEKEDYIKWVDFQVPYEALERALKWDMDSHTKEDLVPVNWIEMLA